jgi:hypothetical protein
MSTYYNKKQVSDISPAPYLHFVFFMKRMFRASMVLDGEGHVDGMSTSRLTQKQIVIQNRTFHIDTVNPIEMGVAGSNELFPESRSGSEGAQRSVPLHISR